jgi:hypothetical protein
MVRHNFFSPTIKARHSGLGRIEPIPFQVKRDLTGLGKTNQDVRMIETTVSQRRGLDSERQQKETEEQRRARQVCSSASRPCAGRLNFIPTGFRCAPNSSTNRNFGYPQSLLLRSLRQTVQERCAIRRAHQLIRTPSQSALQGHAG